MAGAAAFLALAGCSHSGEAARQSQGRAGHSLGGATSTSAAPTTSAPSPTETTMPPTSDTCGASIGLAAPGASPTTVPVVTSWQQRTVVAGTCPQIVDLAMGAGFSLVSSDPNDQGPWVLQRIDIGRATTESGADFSVGTLYLAAGYLWISCGRATVSDATGPLLCQVDPDTLAVVRQIQLPSPRLAVPTPPGEYPLSITSGPGDTVWIGYGQTLVLVDAGRGAVLFSVPITSGTVASLSVDPTQRYLYVALSYPTISGKPVDAAVLEFGASSGRLLAGTSAQSAVTDSVAGGVLTAVGGGVWMSFRTGMLGETILLRQSDLAMVGPPSSDLEEAQPDGVFRWIMAASTIYGNGALVVVNENGVMACADPLSGVVRAQVHLTDAEGSYVQLLAVDGTSGQVFANDGGGLEAITPPPACWG